MQVGARLNGIKNTYRCIARYNSYWNSLKKASEAPICTEDVQISHYTIHQYYSMNFQFCL